MKLTAGVNFTNIFTSRLLVLVCSLKLLCAYSLGLQFFSEKKFAQNLPSCVSSIVVFIVRNIDTRILLARLVGCFDSLLVKILKKLRHEACAFKCTCYRMWQGLWANVSERAWICTLVMSATILGTLCIKICLKLAQGRCLIINIEDYEVSKDVNNSYSKRKGTAEDARCQFHQRSTSSFCTRRF